MSSAQPLLKAIAAFETAPLSISLSRTQINAAMTNAFEGARWHWRSAYDAIEGAIVRRFIASGPGALQEDAASLLDLADRLQAWSPTQTIRSTSSQRRELFSTPPVLSAAAALLLNPSRDARILEPSAGNGSLAAPLSAFGVKLTLNELDTTAADTLRSLFPRTPVLSFDGAIIDAGAAAHGPFDHAVLNPPFENAERHLFSAFNALADGGSLVAILPARFRNAALFAQILAGPFALTHHLILAPRLFAQAGVSTETVLVRLIRSAPSGEPVHACIDNFAELRALVLDNIAAPTPARRVSSAQPVVQAPGLPSARSPASLRIRPPLPGVPLAYEVKAPTTPTMSGSSAIYARYTPSRLALSVAAPHAAQLVETLSMASVGLPEPVYRPALPKRLVSSGDLSAAQLEAIVYAGQAHERYIPGFYTRSDDGTDLISHDSGEAYRYGFFLGDGTGVGKGRTVAGILMDNLCRGRTKALWLSESAALIEDARRDWTDLGGRPQHIVDLRSHDANADLRARDGILFSTYATLRNQGSQSKRSRLEQVLEYLGDDFDGVIIFDEAHAMGSATEIDGFIGKGQASLTGLTGLRLQNAVPNARVIYASATGASHVHNIAYATRLGLWGCAQTPFDTRAACLSNIDSGGPAALELLVRELKGRGLFLSRALSYECVEYDPLEHTFTDADIALWDSWSEAWTTIHNSLNEALLSCGITGDSGEANSPSAKAAARSAFESSKLRFFGHLLQSIQTPTFIKSAEADIRAGHAPVVQVTSTNEAVLSRRLDQTANGEPDQIEFTPKEYVIDYLERAFPVTQYQASYSNEGSIIDAEPALDADGNRIMNPAALQARDQLLTRLHLLPNCIGALDQLLFHFGPERIAECTGRSRRLIKRGTRQDLDRRGTNANTHEAQRFMDGHAELLVFSDAGGTGRSYHASKTARNQKRRVHYLIEPGWRANKAIQGLGRSHRTNQASAPLFRVLTTNLAGQKRFTSTISQRLETLGAFTKGDRRSAGESLFSPLDNLSGPIALSAYNAWVHLLADGRSAISMTDFQHLTGLHVVSNDGQVLADLPPINRWLNRLLALPVHVQNAVFEEFFGLLQAACDFADSEGSLDRSIAALSADTIRLVERHELPADTNAFAPAFVSVFETSTTPRRIAFENALPPGQTAHGYYLDEQSGRPVITFQPRLAAALEGTPYTVVTCATPLSRYHAALDGLTARLVEVDKATCAAAWTATLKQGVVALVERVFVLHGSCLHLWRGLPSQGISVRRVTDDAGDTVIGRLLSAAQAKQYCSLAAKAEPAHVVSALAQMGDRVETACGLCFVRTRHMDRPCLEIQRFDRSTAQFWTDLGAELVIHNYTPRLMVPASEISPFVHAVMVARPDLVFQL